MYAQIETNTLLPYSVLYQKLYKKKILRTWVNQAPKEGHILLIIWVVKALVRNQTTKGSVYSVSKRYIKHEVVYNYMLI